MGALGAEDTSDKQRTYGGERWLLVTVAVGTGLSTRNGIETRIYVHHSLWVALMTFNQSCFTSSSVRLVFSTTLTWEIGEKMSIKYRFCLQLGFFFPSWDLFLTYLIVPARSGLKAYSQSCMSLSFVAWSNIPRCSVHTANVFGVCGESHESLMQQA